MERFIGDDDCGASALCGCDPVSQDATGGFPRSRTVEQRLVKGDEVLALFVVRQVEFL